MNSIQINIEARQEEQEILISELADLGAEGFEQKEGVLIAYFSENNFKSYEVNQTLQEFHFLISTLKEQNWNEIWEQNFQPVIVDDFCAVRADFHPPIKEVAHEIIITPKMSFGTGHHATTYMMMEQMKDIDFRGLKVFDFGTGTGILAILAEQLGSARIEAIDVDEWSIRNARENVAKNNCSRIHLELSTKIPDEKFDIVLANINRNVIMEYLPSLFQVLSPGGLILFSGLLNTDRLEITEACQDQGLQLQRGNERNNWISLLFSKPAKEA